MFCHVLLSGHDVLPSSYEAENVLVLVELQIWMAVESSVDFDLFASVTAFKCSDCRLDRLDRERHHRQVSLEVDPENESKCSSASLVNRFEIIMMTAYEAHVDPSKPGRGQLHVVLFGVRD